LPPPPSYEELTLATPSSAGTTPPTASMAAGTLQKVIRVLREAGVPLGMSVAGGIGSNPYGKGNEVGAHGQADMFNLKNWPHLSAGHFFILLLHTDG
jgi:hypothetical protein